ncbi:DUF3618 domain-containing protein [Streptomyces purpurogeneiscleroticus]|uniref:DUF3618 domain-containing protein n=1 Tax=Streptomyces purpurogeneiscleroticus TaxID=68259 RepID=UPI001CBCC697|nr:DUF3618 domain-containing protein [Streptomyces purpurogeneiscleroticus]MBZ4016276.1 hypothetical protein [Streptomyces purpurogeneiscleroticus]
MGTTPDELRQEADATRTHLTQTVDQLADRVSPPRVARRKAGAARDRLSTIKDKVMGTSGPGGPKVGEKVRGATEQLAQQAKEVPERLEGQAQQAPARIREQTQGSPLAAGLIAFGAGMLTGALFPATPVEERMGREVRDRSEDLVQPLKETAQEAAQNVREQLREPARQAASAVQETAEEAGRSTKEQAKESGREAGEEIRRTGRRTTGEARREPEGP